MSTKKPELRDYGITLEEYALYYGSSDLPRACSHYWAEYVIIRAWN